MAIRLEKPQIIVHVHKDVPYTLYDAKWIPSSAKFVTLGSHPKGTGALQVYEISSGSADMIKQAEKQTAFKCGTFGATHIQQRHLATGDFKGRLMTWDLESLELPVYSAKAHEDIINVIDGCGGVNIGGGAPEIVTGSRDGAVKVWDTRQRNRPVATMSPGEGEARRDCWSVAFGDSYNDEERCVCAGYDNGDVKLFDLRKMALRWETNLKNGICCVEFDRKDIMMNKLVVTTLESKFHVFDMRTQHRVKGFTYLTEKVKQATVWTARHLPQNRDIFMTSGGNGSLNLWKYCYPEKRTTTDDDGLATGVVGSVDLLQNVTLSSQPIASFEWNRDKEGLAVCTSFDQSFRIVIVTKLNRV